MNLHLILTAHWFNMHYRGGKDIEYRSQTEHWIRRLFDHQGEPKKFTTVTFQLGYAKDAPRIVKIFKGLSTGTPVKGWAPDASLGCMFFQIHTGVIVSTENLPTTYP